MHANPRSTQSPGAAIMQDVDIKARIRTVPGFPKPGVLLVDDLIATGGTAEAALHLIGVAGGSIVGRAFVVDLPALGGREWLERVGYPVLTLCEFAAD